MRRTFPLCCTWAGPMKPTANRPEIRLRRLMSRRPLTTQVARFAFDPIIPLTGADMRKFPVRIGSALLTRT